MQLQQYVVDAFTQQVFGGNPAAVVVLEAFLEESLMQNIAAENNLSETAFVVAKNGVYHIRWFSPLTEIDFCGHASLASAYVLQRFYGVGTHIVFACALLGEFSIDIAADGIISMTFPNRAPVAIADVPPALLAGLSIAPQTVLQSPQAYFAVYASEAEVRALNIEEAPLKTLKPYDVVATAPCDGEYAFVSRYFWPANGGHEDPVTGSIHAGLFPYWGVRLHEQKMTAKQISARGGVLYGELVAKKVIVSGYAKLYAASTLYLDE
ncbi:PhzF family phenazine biosynthesis protein [Vitreoscilla massiliensis]|uniref:PhzF family phenazine biosynthesis protein n=1 Tax=Vitreoscilla massiliensis TaxID=1689272 RepID=A0ABY4E0L9_9NEIS|nr:PhzF family phenazine biosynthesis protein [Vitreoscilla massiliensis]UOO89318.1 PhzF family phenazine biosynthesis protein [Vitreoscilla massiliensis]